MALSPIYTTTVDLSVSGSAVVISGLSSTTTQITAAGFLTGPQGAAGSGSGSSSDKLYNLATVSNQSANFTATANTKYNVNTTSGTITATLPATNILGQTLFIQKSDATTNILNISGTINGTQASVLPIRTQLQAKLLQGDGTGNWNVIAGDLSLPSLDARYAQLTAVPTGDLGGTYASPTVSFANDTLHVLRAGDTMTGTLTGRSLEPSATNTYNLGTTNYYAQGRVSRLYVNATSYLDGGAAGITRTNGDIWGDKGFKFGAGASTGTDPFSGYIAGIKGYVAASVLALQGFNDSFSIQEWKNSSGVTMLKVLGASGVLQPNANNGTDLGTSSLYFANAYVNRLSTGTATVSAATTLTGTFAASQFCNATAAAFTITIPAASSVPGMTLNIKKIDSTANAVIVATSGGNIDAAATYTLSTQYKTVVVQSNGTQWYVIGVV